jgi:hypothetical protein
MGDLRMELVKALTFIRKDIEGGLKDIGTEA